MEDLSLKQEKLIDRASEISQILMILTQNAAEQRDKMGINNLIDNEQLKSIVITAYLQAEKKIYFEGK